MTVKKPYICSNRENVEKSTISFLLKRHEESEKKQIIKAKRNKSNWLTLAKKYANIQLMLMRPIRN